MRTKKVSKNGKDLQLISVWLPTELCKELKKESQKSDESVTKTLKKILQNYYKSDVEFLKNAIETIEPNCSEEKIEL